MSKAWLGGDYPGSAGHVKHPLTLGRDSSSRPVIPLPGGLSQDASKRIHEYVAKTLPGTAFSIELVDEIPLTAAGKRRVVVVDKAA